MTPVPQEGGSPTTRSLPESSEAELLPPVFARADAASQAAERRHLRATAARLLLSIAAAALSAQFFVDEVRVYGLLAAAAFFAAFLAELWMLARPVEATWYEGRAIAESAKTAAWRYAVGGDPFPLSDPGAATRLAHALDDLDRAASSAIGVVPGRSPITDAMEQLREAPLERRRSTYLRDRVADQRDWYLRKASATARRASQLKITMLVLEALGVAFALAEAFSLTPIALSGVAATAIGAGAAWLTVRQHESTARTYAVASQQLGPVADRLLAAVDEAQWASEVGRAEEAITREHAAWHAARTARDLPVV